MKDDILNYVFTQEEILVLIYKLIEKLHEITEEVNELQAQQSKDNETKLAGMRVELEEFARQIGVFAQNTKDEQDRLVAELEKLDEVVEAKVSDAGADIDAAVDELEDRIEALRAEIPVLKEKTGSELMSLIGTIPFDRVEGLAEIARQLNTFSEVTLTERTQDNEFVKGELKRVEEELNEKLEEKLNFEDKFKELNVDMYKLSQELVNITPRIEVFVDGNKYASVHRLNFVGSTVTNDNGLVTVTNATGEGVGDVVGPASATDNAITRFDGTTGKVIQNSNATVSDDGVASVDAVQLDITPTTASTAVGMLRWNSDEGTIDIGQPNGVTQQVGQEQYFYVKNQTGGTLLNGKPVMFAGAVGASGRLKAQYAIADNSVEPHYIMGVLTQDIADGDDGYVTWFGKVRGIDTTGSAYGETWAEGDRLYVSDTVAGALTNVPPNTPSHQITVAAVVTVHAVNGVLFVRPTWRGNITDLDDVNGTSLTTSGQIMVWDNAAGYFDFTANINDKADKSGAGDIEITDTTKGVIIKSPNGTRFRIGVTDNGELTTTSL